LGISKAISLKDHSDNKHPQKSFKECFPDFEEEEEEED
jgi:hypothetical protein